MKAATLYRLFLFFIAGFMTAAAVLVGWVAFSAVVGALKAVTQ